MPQFYLTEKACKNMFHFIHNYLNYCNIVWESTNKRKLPQPCLSRNTKQVLLNMKIDTFIQNR